MYGRLSLTKYVKAWSRRRKMVACQLSLVAQQFQIQGSFSRHIPSASGSVGACSAVVLFELLIDVIDGTLKRKYGAEWWKNFPSFCWPYRLSLHTIVFHFKFLSRSQSIEWS